MRDDRRNGISRRSLIVKGLAAGGVVAAGGAATLLSEADNGEAANSRRARRVTRGGVRNVVLVHGAYADGSSWSEVIERLQAAGITATAVHHELDLLVEDLAQRNGSGLTGLTDRLAALDGELRVESPADRGTVVAATIPLPG